MSKTVLPRDPSPSAPSFGNVRHFLARAAKVQTRRFWRASLRPALPPWLASVTSLRLLIASLILVLRLGLASLSPIFLVRLRVQNSTVSSLLASDTAQRTPEAFTALCQRPRLAPVVHRLEECVPT